MRPSSIEGAWWLGSALASRARFPISEDSQMLQVLQVAGRVQGEGPGHEALEDIRLRGKLSSHTQLLALMLGGNKNAPNRNDCAGEQDWLSLLARKECCNGKQVSKTQSTLSSISSQQTATVAITDQRPSASAGCVDKNPGL